MITSATPLPRVAGLLLAAGGGRRYGGPKALAHGGEWLRCALAALLDGGCEPVRVVLGARADEAASLLPLPELVSTELVPSELVVVATMWDSGMAASLRAGLAALTVLRPQPDAVLVHLVDLPDVGADVVRRLLPLAQPSVVARAVYCGQPGHPVLLGRDHWAAVTRTVTGDRGAQDWLAGHAGLRLIECADLACGRDVDTPE